MIAEGDIEYVNNQEKLSVFLLAHNYNLKKGTNEKYLDYSIQLSVVLEKGDNLSYISRASYANLDAIWANNAEEKFYRVDHLNIGNYPALSIPSFDTGNRV